MAAALAGIQAVADSAPAAVATLMCASRRLVMADKALQAAHAARAQADEKIAQVLPAAASALQQCIATGEQGPHR